VSLVARDLVRPRDDPSGGPAGVAGEALPARCATLLIGAAGVTVSKGVDVNAGGTGTRPIGATNSSGVATYSGNIVMNTNVTLSASNASGSTLFSGTLSGSGAITAAGSGTVTLAGANSFTNNVGVPSGTTLVASNNSALGTGTGSTTVSNGATLAVAGNINEDEAINIAGTGVGGNGALRNISGANTNTGNVTLSANATIKAESGTRLSLNNVDITGAANRSVTFDGAGTNLVTGSISTADGSLTNRIIKSGSGELIISNNGTTGTGQVRIGEGAVIIAAGSLTTSTNTATRAIDIGLSGDAVGTSTAANASFLARSGVTVSNSIYIAPSGGDGSFTRTIGTDSESGNVNFNNQMFLGGDVRLTSAGTANFTYSGNITNSGTASVTKIGDGTLTLSASNDWRGSFIAGAGTTILSNGNAVWDTNAVTISNGATVVLGASETIGSLAGAGTMTLGANSLVTGSNSASTTFSGVIQGTGGIFKNGTGTFTLAGSNTFSGDTIDNAGTLAFSNGTVGSTFIRLGPDGSSGDSTSGPPSASSWLPAPGVPSSPLSSRVPSSSKPPLFHISSSPSAGSAMCCRLAACSIRPSISAANSSSVILTASGAVSRWAEDSFTRRNTSAPNRSKVALPGERSRASR
jgi:autotransporter-associated beta strand protein